MLDLESSYAEAHSNRRERQLVNNSEQANTQAQSSFAEATPPHVTEAAQHGNPPPDSQQTSQSSQQHQSPNMLFGQPPLGISPVQAALSHTREYVLLALSFIAALGVDRMILAPSSSTTQLRCYAIFWILWVLLFTGVFWSHVHRKPYSWLAGISIVLLCIWLLLSDAGQRYYNNPEYTALCILSIPALAMMHLQISSADFSVHTPARTALNWLSGCFVQPFTAISQLRSPLTAIWHTEDRDTRKSRLRVTAMSVLVGIPILGLLTALLTSADIVFKQGVNTIIGDIDLSMIAMHAFIVGVLTICCYSLLFNSDTRNSYKEPQRTQSLNTQSLHTQSPSTQLRETPSQSLNNTAIKDLQITEGTVTSSFSKHQPFNPSVCLIVLIAVLALYSAFSAIQFTFLFARQGLPDGYTYAEYARQGFWQLLAVTVINLIGFGLVLIYSPRKPVLDALLVGLIMATAVVLSSSALRLSLYINAYGLTWLRLASLLFMGLVSMILILSIARLRFQRLPLLTLCATLFVCWFVLLGYLNPSAIIDSFNMTHEFTQVAQL
jgi:hypothetical protein